MHEKAEILKSQNHKIFTKAAKIAVLSCHRKLRGKVLQKSPTLNRLKMQDNMLLESAQQSSDSENVIKFHFMNISFTFLLSVEMCKV